MTEKEKFETTISNGLNLLRETEELCNHLGFDPLTKGVSVKYANGGFNRTYINLFKLLNIGSVNIDDIVKLRWVNSSTTNESIPIIITRNDSTLVFKTFNNTFMSNMGFERGVTVDELRLLLRRFNGKCFAVRDIVKTTNNVFTNDFRLLTRNDKIDDVGYVLLTSNNLLLKLIK